jgi:hypothetical protein
MAPVLRNQNLDGDASDSNNFNQEDLARIVAEQIVAAIPTIASQIHVNSNNNHDDDDDDDDDSVGGRSSRKGCSYKTFISCKLLEFHGTEGAVGIVNWIEKMESVIRISDCKDDNVVKYATCSFHDKAPTWWNSEVQTRGWQAIDLMTWEELKVILMEKFCPGNEIQKLEAEFWNLEMKGADVLAYNNRFGELA